jgi:hypothetical protein
VEPIALLTKHARFIGGLIAAQIGLSGHRATLLHRGSDSVTASIAHPALLSSAAAETGGRNRGIRSRYGSRSAGAA